MEQLQQLGCECNKVDMVNGAFEQDPMRAYAGYLSNGNFTISSISQYRPANKLTDIGVVAQSTISSGPIKNPIGIRLPQTSKRWKYFRTPTQLQQRILRGHFAQKVNHPLNQVIRPVSRGKIRLDVSVLEKPYILKRYCTLRFTCIRKGQQQEVDGEEVEQKWRS